MKNYKIKRLLAYFIDYLIITLIISLLSQIKALNPNYEEYQASYKKYQEMYTDIINNSNSNYQMDSEMKKTMYEVSYYGNSYMIIEFSVIILYFTLFPLMFSGQTIGKKITKIKIVHNDDSRDANVLNYFIRALIYPIFSTGLFYCAVTLIGNTVCVMFLKENSFINVNKVLLMVGLIWGYIDAIYGLSRNNTRSLHDVISNTKVIDISNN